MTYEEFSEHVLNKQASYINEQELLLEVARSLFAPYAKAMSDIGLHPLTRREMEDRTDELDRMRFNMLDTHGPNSAAVRAAYIVTHPGEHP